MKNQTISTLLGIVCLCASLQSNGQTFFETADGDGVIAIRSSTLSQIKLSLSSTSISYGYYHLSNKAKGNSGGFIFNGELKAKPNDDGLATLIKNGKLQPGFGVSGAIGYRFNNVGHIWNVLDFYIKPEYAFDAYSIYDTTRKATNLDPLYKTNKGSFGLSLIANYGTSIGKKWNLFLGARLKMNSTTNADDMDKITIQTVSQYPNSTTQTVFSNIEEAKMGTLQRVTKYPLAVDLVLDPGLNVGKAGTNTRLAAFTYFRSDGKENTYRTGFGICLIDKQNPTKVYTSIGYELPTYGKGVKAEDKEKDKGTVFATVGYTF